MVQQEMASRLSGKERYSGVDRFSSKIQCGECGSWFGAKVWHSNDKYRRVVYQCNHKHKFGCSTPHLTARQIEQIFVAAVNRLLTDRDEVMENIRTVQSVLCDTSALEQEEQELRSEMSAVERMMADSIAENARCALNQDEYRQRYDRLADKYEVLQRQLAVVTQGITERRAKREQFQRFMQTLCEQKDFITEFDAALWGSLLECIIVKKDGEVQVLFKDGTSI